MNSPLTERLDVPQKRLHILVPPPQPNPWHRPQQGGKASWFPLPNLSQLDPRDYGGAEIAFNPPAKQDTLSRALFDQAHPNQNFTAQLRSLQQHYTILADDRLITETLEEEASLYALLIEAITPLQHAFGEKR